MATVANMNETIGYLNYIIDRLELNFVDIAELFGKDLHTVHDWFDLKTVPDELDSFRIQTFYTTILPFGNKLNKLKLVWSDFISTDDTLITYVNSNMVSVSGLTSRLQSYQTLLEIRKPKTKSNKNLQKHNTLTAAEIDNFYR